MRASRHAPFAPFALLALGSCAMVACTALLGSYEVTGAQPGPGVQQEGGPGTEGGGPTTEGGGGDAFVPTDGPIDSPPGCAAPKMVCGGVCVDLESEKDNCGACGHSCLGGLCTAHVCQPFSLATRNDVLDRTIAATDTDIFFGTMASDVIQQPVTGSAPIKLATVSGGGMGGVFAIAPAAGRIYFTASVGAGGWQVWKAGIGAAGSGGTLSTSNSGTPVGLVAAGTNLHTLVITSTAPENYQIMACPQDGTACFGNFNASGRPGSKLAAGSGFVFWTDQFGPVWAYPDAVGSRIAIAPSEATPSAPVWDGTTLFWMNGGNGKLRKSPYPMPTPSDFRDITSGANDVLVDAVNVYWSIFNGTDNDLLAAPKAGPATTAPIRLTHGANIGTLAQTASGIYWSDGTAIRGIRKP